LTYREVYGEYIFSLDGEILTIHELIQSEPVTSDFRKLLARGNRNDFTSDLLFVTGVSLISGSLTSLLLAEEEFFWEAGAAGLGMLLIGLPLDVRAERFVRQAVNLFNLDLPVGARKSEWRFGKTPNGVGLCVRW
jgi:hypothetical protein